MGGRLTVGSIQISLYLCPWFFTTYNALYNCCALQFHIHVFLSTQFMIHIQLTCNRRLVWPARSQVEASRGDPIDHGVHSKGCYGHQRSGILKFQGSGQLLFPKSQLQSHPLPGRRYPTRVNSGKYHLHFNFGCEWRYFGPFPATPP